MAWCLVKRRDNFTSTLFYTCLASLLHTYKEMTKVMMMMMIMC